MWTASLDHLLSSRETWSIHSRLDPVVEIWQKGLVLRPFSRRPHQQLHESTSSTPENCETADTELRQDACCSTCPSLAVSPQPVLVDFAAAPLYLKRPYIDRYYLIGKTQQIAMADPTPRSHSSAVKRQSSPDDCALEL